MLTAKGSCQAEAWGAVRAALSLDVSTGAEYVFRVAEATAYRHRRNGSSNFRLEEE